MRNVAKNAAIIDVAGKNMAANNSAVHHMVENTNGVSNAAVKLLSVGILIACSLLLASCGGAVGAEGIGGGLGGIPSDRSEERTASEFAEPFELDMSREPSDPGAPDESGASSEIIESGDFTDLSNSSEPAESDGATSLPLSDSADEKAEVSASSATATSAEAMLPIANEDAACEYVRKRLESAKKNVPPVIECLGMDRGRYKVHGYTRVKEPEGGHTMTQFWYDVRTDGAIFDATFLALVNPNTMELYDPFDTAPLSEFDAPSDAQYICKLGGMTLNAWVRDGYLMVVGEAECWPFDGKNRDSAEIVSMHHAFYLGSTDVFSDAEPDVEGVEGLARFLPGKYPCYMEVNVESGAVTFVRIYE